jgi:hypothetical protein
MAHRKSSIRIHDILCFSSISPVASAIRLPKYRYRTVMEKAGYPTFDYFNIHPTFNTKWDSTTIIDEKVACK